MTQPLQLLAACHSLLYPPLKDDLDWQESPPWGCSENSKIFHWSDAHPMPEGCVSAVSSLLCWCWENSGYNPRARDPPRVGWWSTLFLIFCLALFFPCSFGSFSAFLHSLSHLLGLPWWLRICLAKQGTQVWSLVGELRSHVLQDT